MPFNTLYDNNAEGFLIVPFKILILAPILSFFSRIAKILGSLIFPWDVPAHFIEVSLWQMGGWFS